MKKIILISALLIIGFSVFSQETERFQGNIEATGYIEAEDSTLTPIAKMDIIKANTAWAVFFSDTVVIANLSPATRQLFNVDGAIQIGNSTVGTPGAIRYTGTAFEGYVSSWGSLGGVDSSYLHTKYDEDTTRANALDLLTDDFSTTGQWEFMYVQIDDLDLFNIDTIASGDATPDVSVSNMLCYKGASAVVTLTDLDNPKTGVIYTIIGGEYPLTIETGGNFKIDEDITLYNNDVISFACFADDYYVRNSYMMNSDYDWFVSTTGNDGWAGTSAETAFLTLGAANTAASDGDKILMLPGAYDMGTLTISKEIEIDGYGVTITDNSVGASWFSLSGTKEKIFRGITFDSDVTTGQQFTCSTSSNNEWDNCTFSHAGTLSYIFLNGYGSGTNTVDGCSITCGASGVMAFGTEWVFDDCTIDSIRSNAFYRASNIGDLTIQNSTLNVYSSKMLYCREDGWVNIIDNTINLTGNISYLAYTGSGASGDKNINWDGNTIIAGSYTVSTALIYGPTASSFDTIYISDNTITATSNLAAIFVYPDDTCSITGNSITLNGTGDNDAIWLSSTGSIIGINISSNEIYSQQRDGHTIIVGTETSGSNDDKISGIMEKNYCLTAHYYAIGYSSETHGYMSGFNKDIIIRHNYINGAQYGIAIEHDGTDYDGYLLNNVIAGCEQGIRSKGGASLKIYGNTFICDSDSTVAAIYINSSADTCDIRNNIIYYGTGISSSWIYTDVTGANGITIDYNLCYGEDDDPYYAIGGVSYDGWSVITNTPIPGFEQNGLNTDPKFEPGYYYLDSESDAFEAGFDLGTTYEIGLGRTTVWPTSIIISHQPTNWTIGAYID